LVDVTAQSEAAAWTYRAQLADFVKRVIAAYWVVVFTRQNLVVQQESLELARQTLRENNERVWSDARAGRCQGSRRRGGGEQQVIVANLLDNALHLAPDRLFAEGRRFLPR
jgi:hypothetical protein